MGLEVWVHAGLTKAENVEVDRDGYSENRGSSGRPAAVRFLSVEPLLEDVGKLPLEGLSWVIVGGESGPRRSPHAGGLGSFNPGAMQGGRRGATAERILLDITSRPRHPRSH